MRSAGAIATAVLLLVQALGLNLLCFCGHCSLSQALLGSPAPVVAVESPEVHACCHSEAPVPVAATAPALARQGGCCGDAHEIRKLEARVDADPRLAIDPPAATPLATMLLAPPVARSTVTGVDRVRLEACPGDAGPPLYVRQLALLI